jgi:gliding motility-associated lipoprotein GldD
MKLDWLLFCKTTVFCSFLIGCVAFACQNEQIFIPKPRGYHRISLPKASYQTTPDSLPYFFEYSQEAKLLRDSSVVAKRHWFEMYYPEFTANIDISYYPIKGDKAAFEDFVNDSHNLAVKHKIKAYAIDEITFRTPNGNSVILFELKGDVPSQLQFYVTDSTRNFLRGSLYFPTNLHNDSLAPVIDFIKKDMLHIVNTVQWKNK